LRYQATLTSISQFTRVKQQKSRGENP